MTLTGGTTYHYGSLESTFCEAVGPEPLRNLQQSG